MCEERPGRGPMSMTHRASCPFTYVKLQFRIKGPYGHGLGFTALKTQTQSLDRCCTCVKVRLIVCQMNVSGLSTGASGADDAPLEQLGMSIATKDMLLASRRGGGGISSRHRRRQRQSRTMRRRAASAAPPMPTSATIGAPLPLSFCERASPHLLSQGAAAKVAAEVPGCGELTRASRAQ